MENNYDVIIIGAGPAGLSAAIYATRARLSVLVIERQPMSGGQVLTTYEVDNYPGLPGISGYDLATKLHDHAKQLGAEFLEAQVSCIIEENGIKKIVLNELSFMARAVAIATGAKHRLLGVPGEAEFSGAGVSYCATCDGAFFRDKTVAVVGGGDVAVEDAVFLARICKKVYVIHRRDQLRAIKVLQERLLALDNVAMIWDSVVKEIQGNDSVEAVMIANVQTGEEVRLIVSGVFVAVGISPNSREFTETVCLDEQGYILSGEDCRTSCEGIYAIGDVRTKPLRQIITAAADGANVITSIQEDLLRKS